MARSSVSSKGEPDVSVRSLRLCSSAAGKQDAQNPGWPSGKLRLNLQLAFKCIFDGMSTEINVAGKNALHLVYFLWKLYIAFFVSRLTNREIRFIYRSHG